jgi:hypothetical protein
LVQPKQATEYFFRQNVLLRDLKILFISETLHRNQTFVCPNYTVSAFSRLSGCHIQTITSGEGSRSRRYGRTAALRLLVQPCDEDDDDDYFCPFPSNGAPVE